MPCRRAQGHCDLPEVCSGRSGECPPDLFVKNAVPCNNGRSYCFNGRCQLMQDQCESIWGHKATVANSACFQQFNTGGTVSGNCGRGLYGGQFKQCAREYERSHCNGWKTHVNGAFFSRHIDCGTLHCQGGSSKPMIPQVTYTSHTQTVNGEEVNFLKAADQIPNFFLDIWPVL